MRIPLKASERITISDPSKVQRVMKPILDNESELDKGKEHTWVVGANIKNIIIYIELVHLGTTNYAMIEPKPIFRTAIFHNADAIVLVHNHPSGITTPSAEDQTLTEKLKDVGEVIGIPLLDHVIISNSDDSYYSFQEENLM